MGRALVISSAIPSCKGNTDSRMVFAACVMMADLGFKQTLLHVPFDGKWQWRKQDINSTELKRIGVVQEIEIYPENATIGKRRIDGHLHSLDDWCASNVELFLINHLRRNFYDVVIVQSVWLSKYFGAFQNSTIKILLAHDHLNNRCTFPKIFDLSNTPYVSSENYVCLEKDEIFGLERSDIVICNNKEYATWMRSKTKRAHIIEFPTAVWEPVTGRLPRYRHSDKVIFGLIDERRLTSRYHLIEFLSILKNKLLAHPTATEIIIYGHENQYIDTRVFPFVKLSGQDTTLASFYDAIDFVLAPHSVHGELSLAVSDAIGHEVPVLTTVSSVGMLNLPEAFVYESPSCIADVVIDLTIRRPKYDTFSALITNSKPIIVNHQNISKKIFSDILEAKSSRFVVYYSELSLAPNHPLFAAVISTLRLLCSQGRVSVLANADEFSGVLKIVSQLPSSIEVVAMDLPRLEEGGKIVIDASASEGFGRLMRGAVYLTSSDKFRSRFAKAEYMDERIASSNSRLRTLLNLRDETRLALSLFSEDLRWDPNIIKPRIPNADCYTLLIKLNDQRLEAFDKYLKKFYPEVTLVSFKDESNLIEKLSNLLATQKINKTIFMNTPASATEYCLFEYLKFFGFSVLLYNGIKSLDSKEIVYESRINSHNLEPYLTRRAISKLSGYVLY